jgi:hypothetical protein
VNGAVDGLPLYEQLLESDGAERRETVKALIALVLFPPLAEKQALRFESPEKRIKSAFFDLHATVRKCLPERVAVVLFTELDEDGQNEAAPPQLEPKVIENGLESFAHTVSCILYYA